MEHIEVEPIMTRQFKRKLEAGKDDHQNLQCQPGQQAKKIKLNCADDKAKKVYVIDFEVDVDNDVEVVVSVQRKQK